MPDKNQTFSNSTEEQGMSHNPQMTMQSTKILKATHTGILKIGGVEISCAVLKDGTRILSASSIFKLFGKTRKGLNDRFIFNGTKLPPFLALKRLESLLTQELIEWSKPIEYIQNGHRKFGYHALLLPEMCDLFISARNNQLLTGPQNKMATYAEILLSGLARTGAIALIDEATGYQELRESNALQQILARYLQPHARAWVKTFPDAFFEKLCRVYGINMKNGRTPWRVGQLILDIVYDRLAPGITRKLREINPTDEKGHKKNCHHQLLTGDEGLPELKTHLIKTMVLMDAAQNKNHFREMLDRVIPKPEDSLKTKLF